ncbi:MAG TPA: HAMP domain-containing sensor histidine kinase [Trueperaceae bacterium]|nr:HAMP domain-containing sensor histidine kinase [Trueperaceae bacterium]
MGILLTVSLVVALLAVAIMADALFERQQLAELQALLDRELDRVERLLAEGGVGEQLLDEAVGKLSLQFVTAAGAVVIPGPDEPPIPLQVEPTMTTYAERPVLVGSTPWRLAGGPVIGTVRLAYDVEDALQTRANLRSALLVAGLAIAAITLTVSLLLVGRELRPLARLAQRADELDPIEPVMDLEVARDDEVGRVASALHRAVEAIRLRKVEEREALAAVAHELAAPLTVVAGQLEALAQRDDDPRLHAAHEAARELLHTSRDLLTLARGELNLPVDLEVVSLAGIAQRVAAEYQGVAVQTVGAAQVLGSEIRLAQVVRNLIRNAVQAAGSGEGVVVRVDTLPANVTLDVLDDGPGMEPEVARRAFERNFTTRPDGRGHGLGLAVVKSIVEAHGGAVELRSEVGEGARVVVTLPSLDASLSNDDA